MEGDGDRICRNCHEGGGELIRPCDCGGSIGWVHRHCLDTWRTVSPNPASFYRCDVCHASYRLRRRPLSRGRRAAFHLKAARDVSFVLGGAVAIVALCGAVLFGIFALTDVADAVPAEYQKYLSSAPFVVFVGGLCVLGFIIGIAGICYGIARCLGDCCNDCCSCEAPHYRYNTYSYHGCPPWYWWWLWSPPSPGPVRGGDCCGDCCTGDCNCSGGGGDCNCSGGGGGGGGCDGDAGKALIIVLAVVVVAIIVFGLFVGVGLIVYACSRLVRNHVRLLRKEQQAQELEVVDREKFPEVQSDEVNVGMDEIEPTAPLMPGSVGMDDDAKPAYTKL